MGDTGEGTHTRGGWPGSQVMGDCTGPIKNLISDPRSNAELWKGKSRGVTW